MSNPVVVVVTFVGVVLIGAVVAMAVAALLASPARDTSEREQCIFEYSDPRFRPALCPPEAP